MNNMKHLTKILEYLPISNPSGKQGLVSNSRMSHPPYSKDLFLFEGTIDFPIYKIHMD